MPERFKKIRGAKPKGVANRNRGLKWIRQNAADGVVYFADDDNTYDVRLFNEVSIARGRVSVKLRGIRFAASRGGGGCVYRLWNTDARTANYQLRLFTLYRLSVGTYIYITKPIPVD